MLIFFYGSFLILNVLFHYHGLCAIVIFHLNTQHWRCVLCSFVCLPFSSYSGYRLLLSTLLKILCGSDLHVFSHVCVCVFLLVCEVVHHILCTQVHRSVNCT